MFENEIKNNVLHSYFERLGYQPEEISGYKRFKIFDSYEDELNSLNNGVGLRDISDSGIFQLSGKDSLDYLNRISTNSIKDLGKDNLSRTIFTTEKGKIIDTATILNFEDYQLLICSSFFKNKVKSWIEKYIIIDDVRVVNTKDKYSLLELIGPQVESFMTLVCGGAVDEVEANKFKSIMSEGILFNLARIVDKNGSQKFWILCSPDNSVKLVDFMINNKGIFDFNLIGEDAYNCYRIIKGIPSTPNELNDQFNPHEANLIDLLSSTKGCYIGQEVIARLETYDKVQKYLKGISFDEQVHQNDQLNLFDENGNDAGVVTSVGYSAKCGRHIGLAYIRKSFIESGTRLLAKDGNGNKYKAIVENLPFRK